MAFPKAQSNPSTEIRDLVERLQSTSTSRQEKLMLIERHGIESKEIPDELITMLNDADESKRKEVAQAVIDAHAVDKLMRTWMMDKTKLTSDRITAIQYLRGPFLKSYLLRETFILEGPRDPSENNYNVAVSRRGSEYDEDAQVDEISDSSPDQDLLMRYKSSELKDWDKVANDPDSRVAAAAKDAMLAASATEPALFPFFMRWLLYDCQDQDRQNFELGRRYSSWNMYWLPYSDATELWKDVPQESLMLVARILDKCDLGNFLKERAGLTASVILRHAPSLPVAVIDVLTILFNDAGRPDSKKMRGEIMHIPAFEWH